MINFLNKQLKLPMHSFTPEDLIQYLYKETSQDKTAAIKAALASDWLLREEYEVISGSVKGLVSISLSPRDEAVDNILKYAERAGTQISTIV